jgi:hypothetical protein
LVINYPEFKPVVNNEHFFKLKSIIKGLYTEEVVDGKIEMSYDKKFCKWVGEDDFDLYKCEKFTLFNILFKLIYNLLSLYNDTHPYVSNDRYIFPFYFNYVIKSTSELGSPTTTTPVLEFAKIPECQITLPNMKHAQSLSTLIMKQK